MDYSRDFEIDATGQHWLIYYELRVLVPPPSNPLSEMKFEEYDAYFHSVLPLLHAHPEYQKLRFRMKAGERFVM